MDGDGAPEVVVTDFDGGVHVWRSNGEQLASVRTDERFSRQGATDSRNRMKRGISGSAALGDLDGDDDLEVVVAAMDRHVYAWHHDGAPVDGFPVLVVDPSKIVGVDPGTHQVTFGDEQGTGQGGELIATPTLADIAGDDRPEIVVGAQEQYSEPVQAVPGIGAPGGNTRLYAISPDGTASGGAERSAVHPDEQAYVAGWPVPLPMVLTSVLPTIGDGVSVQAAAGDVDRDGELEIVATSVSGQTRVLNGDGSGAYGDPFGLPVTLNWLGAVGPGRTAATPRRCCRRSVVRHSDASVATAWTWHSRPRVRVGRPTRCSPTTRTATRTSRCGTDAMARCAAGSPGRPPTSRSS